MKYIYHVSRIKYFIKPKCYLLGSIYIWEFGYHADTKYINTDFISNFYLEILVMNTAWLKHA